MARDGTRVAPCPCMYARSNAGPARHQAVEVGCLDVPVPEGGGRVRPLVVGEQAQDVPPHRLGGTGRVARGDREGDG